MLPEKNNERRREPVSASTRYTIIVEVWRGKMGMMVESVFG